MAGEIPYHMIESGDPRLTNFAWFAFRIFVGDYGGCIRGLLMAQHAESALAL